METSSMAERGMEERAPAPPVFEEDPPAETHRADVLLLNIDGYEGPLDVLLQLARDQKVDLSRLSILQLARQYLAFVDRARARRLELAADYLVMAAWLAYLKSRLLLPVQTESGEAYGAQEMAEALQFQLRRLEAMRAAAQTLSARPRLGEHVFARGCPETISETVESVYDVTLYDMMRAYGDMQKRTEGVHYEAPNFPLMSMDKAMARMERMLGTLPKNGVRSVWTRLQNFVPEGIRDRLFGRSALASLFTASLELVKQGRLEVRQDGAFRPVYMRTIPGGDSE